MGDAEGAVVVVGVESEMFWTSICVEKEVRGIMTAVV